MEQVNEPGSFGKMNESMDSDKTINEINRYMGIGFNFSFFGKQEVRKFNYRPRFYDPEAEERRQKYGDFTKPKPEGYAPGQHLKGSFRDGNYSRTRDVARNQKALGVITMVLLFAVVYLVYEYFPILIDSLSR